MRRIFLHGGVSQGGHYDQFAQFQCGDDGAAAQLGQIVFVRASNFFEQSVQAQPSEQSRYLRTGFVRQHSLQSPIRQATNVKFSTSDPNKQTMIFPVEEVESPHASSINLRGPGNFLDTLESGTGVIDIRDELEVTFVGCPANIHHRGDTVDGLSHRSLFLCRRAVAVFYRSVVFKKTQVVDRGLDSENSPEFVVHLDRGLAGHVVFDTRTLYSRMVVVTQFAEIVTMKFSSEERGYVVRFDGVNGRTGHMFVDGLKIICPLKDNVSGVLCLHDTPMISLIDLLDNRAEAGSVPVHCSMQLSDAECVGQLLGYVPIPNLHEGIILQCIIDAAIVQLSREPVVAIEVKLKAEGAPRGHTQITQAKLLVDEVEIIVQTFASDRFQKGFVSSLVMPRLVCGARFHGRENVNQSGMIAAFFDDISDTVFLAEVLLANEFYFEASLSCDPFGVVSYPIPQWLGEFGVVEDTDSPLEEQGSHCAGVTDGGQCAGNDNTIQTSKTAVDLIRISFRQQTHCGLLGQNLNIGIAA